MQPFERRYARLVGEILATGERRETRNGYTTSVFGEQLKVSVGSYFPLLQGRKMYYKGVLGELAALLRKPTCVADFEKWGCNYWKKWADEDGNLALDYGNAWFDFEGFDQVADLKDKLANNPTDRRMIISSWMPHRISSLSLPCCHYTYQFYVTTVGGHKRLDMVWIQRSVDMMIGLPSDIILAAALLIAVANEFGMHPGIVTFQLGDCHVYEEHRAKAAEYVERVANMQNTLPVLYSYSPSIGSDFCEFEPDFIELGVYRHADPINFELKA